MTILLTGAAGFIGYASAIRLLQRGERVIGLDNLNSYYNPKIKLLRLKLVEEAGGDWLFENRDLANGEEVLEVFERYRPTGVINLAAQAGVRYSIQNPNAYIQSNIHDVCLSVITFVTDSLLMLSGSLEKKLLTRLSVKCHILQHLHFGQI